MIVTHVIPTKAHGNTIKTIKRDPQREGDLCLIFLLDDTPYHSLSPLYLLLLLRPLSKGPNKGDPL